MTVRQTLARTDDAHPIEPRSRAGIRERIESVGGAGVHWAAAVERFGGVERRIHGRGGSLVDWNGSLG